MSIEQSLERIAVALETIAAVRQSYGMQTHEAPQAPQPAIPQAPAMPQPPAYAPPPVPAAPQPPNAGQAPAGIPSYAQPAAPLPFTDPKGLMTYVMQKYAALGPVKGGMIQNVLMELGANNINALEPARYAEFYAKVEAL